MSNQQTLVPATSIELEFTKELLRNVKTKHTVVSAPRTGGTLLLLLHGLMIKLQALILVMSKHIFICKCHV
jgi:hypothetical protein